MRWAVLLLAVALPVRAVAQDHEAIAERAVAVILPAAEAFTDATEALAGAAPGDCAADAEAVRARFHQAWDAWMALQPYRFGPLEEEQRALQIAFWPDPRGMTGRTVERLLATEAAPVDDPAAFAEASVAGRGLPAVERLLWDDAGAVALEGSFRCLYLAAAARDLARLAAEAEADWRDPWSGWMLDAGGTGSERFLAPVEVTQRLYAVLLGALEETVRHRLGAPLGTFDAPRPRLAEAWRSGRSLVQVVALVDAVEAELQQVFFPELDEEARAGIDEALGFVRQSIARVEETGGIPEAVDGPGRIRVEVLMQSVENLALALRQHLGPGVGVAEGFNAADGD